MNRLFKSLLVVGMLLSVSACTSSETSAAKKEFNTEVTRIKDEISQRDKEIETAEALLEKDEEALDSTTEASLESAVSNAKEDTIDIPKCPSDEEEIKKETEKLKEIDLTEEIEDIKTAETLLKNSRKQYQLVVNPTSDYVVKQLKTVDTVKKVAAVTEDNDPNGNLNKAGGYTAQVYFSSSLVKDEDGIFTGDVIEDGTDCGGSVEVYKTVSEAKDRDEYLAGFDGSVLSSGSHAVYGTCVIRTSCELTASNQKKLEQNVLDALTKL